jgi:PKD repeat protein
MQVGADFTLISEPTVYRWNIFESGQTANWYSQGSQTGYTGGGVSEVQSAMAAWNGYASAKIAYAYAGAATVAPGGLSARNSVNEILFNDPLNEIAGTWNRTTGGVVGQGGFTGVTSSSMWTAPFAADAPHPAGTVRAWNISEGNLVVQDGVSPATGISSARLAEIISHELGHTLGFGHTPDSTALMYATVTGGGPSLREDDKLAARWLYPNGDTTGPQPGQAPAAPTNLSASVNGASATLTWTDNATNETSQAIYIAPGTVGAFSKLGDVDPNARTTIVNGLSTGTYRFYVTASNASGESLPSNVATISIAPLTASVAAAFDAFTITPAVNTAVAFTDRSTGAPTKWLWSFGDNGTSNLQNPTHTWTSAGTYLVTLVAWNATTQSTATKTIVVSNIAAFESLVSATAQTSGIGGTSWRTELTVFNAGEAASVDFIYLPADGTIRTKRVFVPALQSVTYLDALGELYGLTSAAGAIAIRSTSPASTPKLKVSSRTFTDGAIGTYGQGVPDVTSFDESLYIAGIQSNAAYRTNVGLVNRTDADVTATLTLRDGDGDNVASANVTIAKNSFRQTSLAALFPSTAGRSYDVLSMSVRAASSNAISVYASVVDNVSQDPIYVQAVPLTTSDRLVLPVVGRAPGANGTYWRSDVTLFNPTSSFRVISLRYAGKSKSLALNGGDSVVLADIVGQMGVVSGSGALEITWSGDSGPIVTSRTYTTVNGGGTFGQSIDPITSFANESFVPGLRMTSDYRSNVGFVNGSDKDTRIDVTLVSPTGAELARTTIDVPASSTVQYSIASLFPTATGTFTLHATSTGSVFAYGSMVDNASGDPVFFAGR